MTQNLPKAVIDTSVFIAAFLSKNSSSASSLVLETWKQGIFTLVISPQLLQELVTVLLRRGISLSEIQGLVTLIAKISIFIPGVYEATRLDNIDPKDNMFLAAAYESNADYLVTLDSQHLLPLKYYHGTQILAPSLFLSRININLNN